MLEVEGFRGSPLVRIVSKPGELHVQYRDVGQVWKTVAHYYEEDPMALHWATLKALSVRRAILEGEDPESVTDDEAFNLHWHALNYRTAGSKEADGMWRELVVCVSNLIKRGYL